MEEQNKRTQPGGARDPGQRPPVKRRKKRHAGISAGIYVIFVLGLSILLATVGWVCANDVLALNKPLHSAVVNIEEGDKFRDVVKDLQDNDIIEYQWLFNLFAAVTGAKEKVTAGTYELSSDMDYRAIITNISASSTARQELTVTIPEGLTVAKIFQLLEQKGVSTVAKLTDMAANHDYKFSFLEEIPMGEATRLEGYLFPDTYIFYRGENPLYVLNKMLVNFDSKLTDELRAEIAAQGKTVRDVVIVASMIERETDGEDQTVISSVIYNRLKNKNGGTNGYLQIDATVQYALPQHKQVLSATDLEVDSPYNTYKYPGLPAGPIANPGIGALRAAIYPKETNYYYYALNQEKRHEFYETYDGFQAYLATLKNAG